MKIHILVQSHVETTRERDSNDAWDRDDTYTDWTILGATRSETSRDSRTLEISYELTNPLYLVYAIYSTGDSFGHDECGSIEMIDLYPTWDAAEACRVALQKAAGHSATIISSSGKEIEVYIPWNGYFEHLNSLEIQTVTV